MNQIRVILNQLKDLYLHMTGAQRLSIVFFGSAIFVLLLAFIMVSTGEEGEKVLFSQVMPKEAARITEKLSEMNVKFRIKNDTIWVSHEANIDAIRISLSEEDLLPEDMSYDFDRVVEENGFVLVKDERDNRYFIAVMNELKKMIEAIEIVDEAKVMISREEPSPLIRKNLERTASVHVKTRGNRRLTKDNIRAICNLVARAVKGMSPEQVSIVDAKGRNYEYGDDKDPMDKLELKERIESSYTQKVEDLLSYIPRVKAKVEISLDTKGIRKEIIDYQGAELNNGPLAVLTKTHSEKETSKSKEGSQGVVGAETNTEATIDAGDGGMMMDSSKSLKTDDLENSVVQTFIQGDPVQFAIKSISIVISDMRYSTTFNPAMPVGPENPEFLPYNWLNQSTEAGDPIHTQVAKALGIPENVISVSQQSMPLELSKAPPSGLQSFVEWVNWTLVSLIALAMLAAIILVSMIRRAQPEEEIEEMPDFEEEDTGPELPPLDEPGPDPKMTQIEKRVKEIIEEDPAKAASLIRHWLSKD